MTDVDSPQGSNGRMAILVGADRGGPQPTGSDYAPFGAVCATSVNNRNNRNRVGNVNIKFRGNDCSESV